MRVQQWRDWLILQSHHEAYFQFADSEHGAFASLLLGLTYALAEAAHARFG